MKKSTLSLLAVSLLITGLITACNSRTPNIKEADLIIGLGLQVNYQSCNSRLLLERRVDRAYAVSLSKENPYFAFAGKGNPDSLKSCFDENGNGLTEAQAMKNYIMVKYNVSAERIILEEQSTSTDENAKYLLPLLADFEQKNGLAFTNKSLVTSAYHNHRQSWRDATDNSSVFYFNRDFGANTFEHDKNVYSSSELGNEKIIDAASQMAFVSDQGKSVKAVGDINNDGKVEIVAVDTSKGIITFVENDSINTTNIPTRTNKAVSLLIIDVNNDDYGDLLIKDEFGDTHVYLNEKNNQFSQTPATVKIPDNSLLSDIDNDKVIEVITFGVDGVYVADDLYSLAPSVNVLNDYGTDQITEIDSAFVFGGLDSDYPRYLADVTGDGMDDIIAFGHNGIFVSVNDGKGGFSARKAWLENDAEGNGLNFTAGAEFAELVLGEGWAKGSGWTSSKHLRGMADIDGDGRADIWAIGEHAVYVAWSTDINKDGVGDGFENLNSVWVYESKYRNNDGNNASHRQFTAFRNWDLKTHPRFFGDVNGDGRADLIGFGEHAVYVSLSENP